MENEITSCFYNEYTYVKKEESNVIYYQRHRKIKGVDYFNYIRIEYMIANEMCVANLKMWRDKVLSNTVSRLTKEYFIRENQ
jgi:hypothetical protein